GAAWVFARSGSTWSQQGPKLTGGEESGAGGFGWSVALSGDGDTALIGGQRDGESAGAAWVFARSGSAWSQQGAKLTGGGEQGKGLFGHAVALSGDGEEALVGAPRDDQDLGAAWVFARSGSTWLQRGAKLTGGDEQGKGELGWSVTLSGEGDTALIGGLGDDEHVGAAWVFVQPPASPETETTSTTTTTTVTGASASAGGASSTVDGRALTPKQGVADYTATGGAIVLLGRRLPVHGGRARVTLRCNAPTACRGRLTLALMVQARAAHRGQLATIATAGFAVAHGRTATVALRLPAAVRRRLRPGRPLGASLTVRQLAPDPPLKRSFAVRLVVSRRAR
ncbi:MAG TPA: FG-GAP repeat protein, partial [Solirubrobacteraceae bacterium]|nr:FG-GAP repeat protein [Solirubrobacteraceae bacterium]